jgi:hypothetical protein
MSSPVKIEGMYFVALRQRPWALILTGLISAGIASPADLAMEAVSAPFGNSVAVQVRVLEGLGPSAAIQFDFEYPSSFSFASSPGPAVSASGKTLYAHTLGAGRTRFLVVGMNSTPIPEGILVSLAGTAGAGTQPGDYSLAVRGGTRSDPGGEDSHVAGAEARLTVGGSIPDSPSGLIAHLSAGGGWRTIISLFNASSVAAPVRIAAWNSGGGPLAIPWAVASGGPTAGTGNPLEWTIQPNGTLDLVAGDPANPEVTVGWAQLSAPAAVSGWITYAMSPPSGWRTETVIPVEKRSPVSWVLPFDNSADSSTGVAVANSSEIGGTVVLVVARDGEGRHLLSDLLQLPARGHTSFGVAQKYSALAGRRGTLEFQNTREGAIAVMGVRFHSSGTLAAISPTVKD